MIVVWFNSVSLTETVNVLISYFYEYTRKMQRASVELGIIVCRLMDNLITLTARSAAVEAAEVTWDTLQPAMILDGRVHAVEDYGVTVQARLPLVSS